MPEVRNIAKTEKPPENADCVVIDRTPSGKFQANGTAPPGKVSGTFFKSRNFETLEQAIAASWDWASQNDVPVVYVRGVD